MDHRRSSFSRFQEPRQASRLRRVDPPLLLKIAEDLLERRRLLGGRADDSLLLELTKCLLNIHAKLYIRRAKRINFASGRAVEGPETVPRRPLLIARYPTPPCEPNGSARCAGRPWGSCSWGLSWASGHFSPSPRPCGCGSTAWRSPG